jgi:streptogramin lyase
MVRNGRITTAGATTEYPIPNASAQYGITAGQDVALWFANYNVSMIGRINTAGAFTEYPIPTASSLPYGITAGPDGALWFTESGADRIGQVLFLTATLTVSPASGSDKTNLSFIGSGFAPDESVQIYTSGFGSAVLASGTTG